MMLMTYLRKHAFRVKRKTYMLVFNMIRRINKAKPLVKHISCEWESQFDSTTCNLNQGWNNDKYQCECKTYHT